MKHIKYIALFLLLVGCAPSSEHQAADLKSSTDKLSKSVHTLMQDYERQKKDITDLSAGMVNIFKPYCRHHNGLNYVTTHGLIADYPFEIHCKDGFQRTLNASDV